MNSKRGRQGRIIRLRLTKAHLSIWLMGLIPMGLLRLDRVVSVTKCSFPGFFRHRRLWGDWLWPVTGRSGSMKPDWFVLETEDGGRIWVPLRSGLHYQIREAVHRNRLKAKTD